jgi:nicotinamide riboside kinase
MPWRGSAKIAFIGSHSVRKSNAVHAFASTIGRAGLSVEVGREVIRFNPLGMNEGATPEAQLWVLMAQIQQELELRHRAEVLVTDRSVVDNFAYYLRVTDGADPYAVEPLVRRWAETYDLFVRLLPDVALLADGVRSTNDTFRDEIEAILDRILPQYIAGDRLVTVPASHVTESFDWMAIAERLAGLRGEVLHVRK